MGASSLKIINYYYYYYYWPRIAMLRVYERHPEKVIEKGLRNTGNTD